MPERETDGCTCESNRKVLRFPEIMGNAFAQCYRIVGGFRSPLVTQTSSRETSVRAGVLLRGCDSIEEHVERIRQLLELASTLRGADGLRAFGLEYRVIHCAEHRVIPPADNGDSDDDGMKSDNEGFCYDVAVNGGCDDDEETVEGEVAFEALANLKSRIPSGAMRKSSLINGEVAESIRSNDGSYFSTNVGASHFAEASTTTREFDIVDDSSIVLHTSVNVKCHTVPLFCHLCTSRLFHIESNTMVDTENRKEFVADGNMYEVVSQLVQEAAQDVMIREGGLEWVTVEERGDQQAEPTCMLISSCHPIVTKEPGDDKSTVLICTGRGKVRGGIFSRQHLICSGLELATAVPLVRDATSRGMHVAILDPNVHGEASGYATFQKTMDFLEAGHFGATDTDNTMHGCRDVYVVSHSASGGHLVRYFLDKCECAFLKNIRAIAFTDSTHSIQWAKLPDKRYLFEVLQGERCVYFRCARARDGIAGDGNKWYLHPAGERVQTDSFWRHRFGTIRTMWAGTNEHSLTNWYSHQKIWEHFDHFLYGKSLPIRHGDGSPMCQQIHFGSDFAPK